MRVKGGPTRSDPVRAYEACPPEEEEEREEREGHADADGQGLRGLLRASPAPHEMDQGGSQAREDPDKNQYDDDGCKVHGDGLPGRVIGGESSPYSPVRVTGAPGNGESLAPAPLKLAGYRFSPSLLPTAAAAALFVLLSGLGFWQLDRAAGKEERQAALKAGRAVVLDETALGGPPREFARVEIGGRYDSSHQFLQDNRTHQGQPGYFVLTPFRTAGHGAVLVNRGWVPVGPDRAVLPEIGAPDGEQRLRGTVRLPREDLFVLGDTGYATVGWPRVVQRVEIDAAEQSLGYSLAAWLVALDPDAPHGYVREWTAAPGLTPDRHRGYAFQWFALATALLTIWVAVNLRRSAA